MRADRDFTCSCGGNLWHLVEKGDVTYAEPCSNCKPNEYEAYMNGRLNHDYFAERDGRKKLTPEQARARNIARAKEEFGL